MSSFSRLGALILLSAAALPAISITSISFEVNGVPPLFSGPSGFAGGVAPAAPGEGDYLYSGLLGVFEGPGLGPSGLPVTFGAPITGPISFRFTQDATVGCVAATVGGFCGKAELNFVAIITFDGPVTDTGGLFGVEGSGSAPNSTATFGVGIEGAAISSINGILIDSTFQESAAFPGGFVSRNAPDNLILAMGFVFNQVPDGASIALPHSLFQQIGVQDANAVPEPGTLAIVGAGFLGAVWFRRRLS